MKNSNEVFGRSEQKNENHSCCGGSGHHHDVDRVDSGKGYQCPMKCEGDKTHDAPGNCPICNMHLAPVK